ncbi:hypothetical protein [Mesobacterium pallidum]|uniref:hypothetical protein n=1 Tax=Mesobacterium pallidum TaxID=2872037 RepID=UPI001EE20BDF|nr:hypothetical protein [Mesobacterium pallidum]
MSDIKSLISISLILLASGGATLLVGAVPSEGLRVAFCLVLVLVAWVISTFRDKVKISVKHILFILGSGPIDFRLVA